MKYHIITINRNNGVKPYGAPCYDPCEMYPTQAAAVDALQERAYTAIDNDVEGDPERIAAILKEIANNYYFSRDGEFYATLPVKLPLNENKIKELAKLKIVYRAWPEKCETYTIDESPDLEDDDEVSPYTEVYDTTVDEYYTYCTAVEDIREAMRNATPAAYDILFNVLKGIVSNDEIAWRWPYLLAGNK